MKTSLALSALLLTFGLEATGQTAATERIVIPNRASSSRPRMVNITTMYGSVTVKAYSGKDIIVECRSSSRGVRHERRAPAEVDGLKRLDLPGSSAPDIDEEDNTVNIRTRIISASDIMVSVPIETSIKIRANNGGDVLIEGVHGEIDVHNLNGKVTLNGVSGTVVAHSLNGPIKVTLDRVDPTKPISFSTLNGEVDVTLPSDFRANLKIKTDNGDIYSDFDIKLDGSRNKPSVTQSDSRGGNFHIKPDRAIYGTLNGGGQEASFTTFNGRISIRKKK